MDFQLVKGYVVGHHNPGPLSGYRVSYPWEGNHWSAGQTGPDRPPWPKSDCGGELYGVLCDHTGHLIAVLCGTADFRSGNHALVVGEGREEIQRRHAEEVETALEKSRAAPLNPDALRMERIQRAGAWLLVLPSTINGTELRAQEWKNYLFLCYGINPTDFLSHYGICGAAFSICDARDCKKWGLTTARHNES